MLRAVWVQVEPTGHQSGVAVRAGLEPLAARQRGALRLRIVEPEPLLRPSLRTGRADEVTLGRSAGCGVSLDDTTVSQLHARLFRQNATLWIEDLGSTNGTWVNRTKVSAPVALKRGDRVTVGGTVLEVTK